tara:strand:+ start:114 stop:1184 length:1071 start_codon:yes stop_codon:yes gene_type:complete
MYYLLLLITYIYYKYRNFLSLLQRLIRKFLFPIKYTVPKLDQFDYPLPPFPNTWYPICSSNNIKQNIKYDFKIASKNIILFRNDKGIIQGVPRNCPHMGVDLMYGNIDNNCIICPMHCKRVSNNTNKKVFIEETNNVIFIWIGEIDNITKKPPFKINDLFTELNKQDDYLYSYFQFQHKVGGHLIDYAEHLLDVKHAPYIHNDTITPIKDGLIKLNHSFITSFHLEHGGVTPVFTYITPTLVNVKYADEAQIYIMFIVHDIGDIDMVILPCYTKTLKYNELFFSFLSVLYTYCDFADEAAFFSTKNHNIRNLNETELEMDNFRLWFNETFYTKEQQDLFHSLKQKNKLLNNELNNW